MDNVIYCGICGKQKMWYGNLISGGWYCKHGCTDVIIINSSTTDDQIYNLTK
jgi:hypothetical protein